jgi:acyl carrier protein
VDSSAIKQESHLMNDLNINSAHLVDVALDVESLTSCWMKNMEDMQTVADAVRIVQQNFTA